MCKMSLIKKYAYALFLALGHISLVSSTYSSVIFDDLLQTTPYAQLLKEVICMADAIGLLNHRINDDEHRFIEDSVLGKITRISRLLAGMNYQDCTSVDIAYLEYWFDLAKGATTSPIILQEIATLEQNLYTRLQQV